MKHVKITDHLDRLFPFDPNLFPRLDGVYLVGGAVRDLLLGKTPWDVDLAVLSDPADFAAETARRMGGVMVPLGKKGKQVHRVVKDAFEMDVCGVRQNDLTHDLMQRDFTVNAMALSLKNGRLADPAGGREDLEKRKIRMVGKAAFSKDPLRMLRAFRLCAELGFDLDGSTFWAICQMAGQIRTSAGERIGAEIKRLLAAGGSAAHLAPMADSGLLFHAIPELKPLSGCRQNIHHKHDVWIHTLSSLAHVEDLLADKKGLGTSRFLPCLNAPEIWLLKFAMLLHDIGKPATKTRDKKGDIHFYGHEAKGGHLVEKTAKSLRFSRAQSGYLSKMTALHTRPRLLYEKFGQNRLTPRQTARFFMKAGPLTPDLLLLFCADTRGKGTAVHGDAPERFSLRLLDQWRVKKGPDALHPPLVTGTDLKRAFGLPSSPLIGKLLEEVEKARLAEEVHTKDQALALAERILRKEP